MVYRGGGTSLGHNEPRAVEVSTLFGRFSCREKRGGESRVGARVIGG